MSATFFCPVKVQCPGDSSGLNGLAYDSPFANLTSESPDVALFFSSYFGDPANPPRLGEPNGTGLGDPNTAPGFCQSPSSQDAADICAQNNQVLNEHAADPTNPATRIYYNTPQQCPWTCPDGSLFYWHVAGGYVVAHSQLQANTIAQSLACRYAAQYHICLGNLTNTACAQANFDATVTCQGTGKLSFDNTAGTLPPGLSLSQSATANSFRVFGSPTQAGVFIFTIRATDSRGNYNEKQYTISVLGLDSSSPPASAMVNRAYNGQLAATGGTAPYTFAVSPGSPSQLPSSLVLSASGAITGTPDFFTERTYPILFQVTDSTGRVCSQTLSFTVVPAPGPDWTQLTWSATPLQSPPNNFATFSGSGAIGSAVLTQPSSVGPGVYPSIDPVLATMVYTGSGGNCRVTIAITGAGTVPADVEISVNVYRNGVLLTGVGMQISANGTTTLNFALVGGAGLTLQIKNVGQPWCGINWANGGANVSMVVRAFNV